MRSTNELLAVSCQLLPRGGRRLPARSGFSLLELMVAIIILGIGMVMVATVFPIGIDMAAQNVQMVIAQATADTAMATLKLKVPPWPAAGAGAHVILAPDVYQTEFGPRPALNPADMDPDDVTALSLSPNAFGSWNYPPYPPQVVERLRFFTERTGWTGELGPSGPGNAWDYAYVIPSQNLWPGYLNPPSPYSPITDVRQLPAMLPPTLGRTPEVFPLNLVDCVYPPVSWATKNPATGEFESLPIAGVLRELAGRRYSWIAIHHITNRDQGGPRFIVTLLVTHRSDLSSRYARQADLDDDASVYNPVFDITDPGVDSQMRMAGWPEPDDDQKTDMLFPQPWLVRFDRVDLGLGEITCSQEVARLLPTGAWFVIGRTNGPLVAGTPYEIIGRRASISPPTLLIRRTGADARDDVYVWVVPPAIQRSGAAYVFQAKSPVAGVFMRMMQ